MRNPANSFALGPTVALVGAALLNCGSSNSGESLVTCSSISADAEVTQEAGTCYPDNDGITGGSYTIELAVNDTGFFATGDDDAGEDAGQKDIIATQNDAQVTLTLTNTGTVPHGFEVGCVSVCPAYPSLPAGCSANACFPANSTIDPIAPGTSKTITFVTPTPDGLLYPFKSSAPADSTVSGLTMGQWSLM